MTTPEFFHLKNASIIEVSGRHATRYLNNRFTNDVTKLHQRIASSELSDVSCAVMRAGALNAQGRLEGLFTVIARASHPENFLLICDGGAEDAEFDAALARYRVAEDVQFKKQTDLRLIHSTAGAAQTGRVIGWNRNRGLTNGVDLLVNKDAQLLGTEIAAERVTQMRILSGEPQFGIDFDSDALLAEIGIEDAVSFTKGCYVGQEVVARIDAMGKPPRLLKRCSVTRSESITDTAIIMQAEKRKTVGEITSSVGYKDSQICFAFIRNDELVLASDALRVMDRVLTIL